MLLWPLLRSQHLHTQQISIFLDASKNFPPIQFRNQTGQPEIFNYCYSLPEVAKNWLHFNNVDCDLSGSQYQCERVLIPTCFRISPSVLVTFLFCGASSPLLLLSCVMELQCPKIIYTRLFQRSATQAHRFPKRTSSLSFLISRLSWWLSVWLFVISSLKCFPEDSIHRTFF